MLVLTRKTQEEICIGDNVVIKILHAGPGKVKIGIDAPKDVRVLRAEKLMFEHEGEIPVSHIQPQSHISPSSRPVDDNESGLRNVVSIVNMIPGELKLKMLRKNRKAEIEARKQQQDEQAVSEAEFYLTAYA